MVSWPPDWQQKLIESLNRAGADRACPRCGHEDFQLLDGYVSLAVQARLGDGPVASVPTVATVCERCGYLSQHVVNVLLKEDIEAAPGGPPAANGPAGQP